MPVTMHMKDQFHTGYAVRDMDLAIASLRERLGIEEWKVMRVSDAAPRFALGFAHAGNMMLELVETEPGAVPFYSDWIPEDPAALRVHHHGYYAQDRDEFDTIKRDFEACGFPMVADAEMPGLLYYRYFDTVALLGHYTEFVLLQAGGPAFFADVPHN